MDCNRLNAYRIMWIIVAFDLPTETKAERKKYSEFRKGLLKDGFTMFQYSIYVRHCSSRENTVVHKRRVKQIIPEHGHVLIFELTDKQFGSINIFYGKKEKPMPSLFDAPSLFSPTIVNNLGKSPTITNGQTLML